MKVRLAQKDEYVKVKFRLFVVQGQYFYYAKRKAANQEKGTPTDAKGCDAHRRKPAFRRLVLEILLQMSKLDRFEADWNPLTNIVGVYSWLRRFGGKQSI